MKNKQSVLHLLSKSMVIRVSTTSHVVQVGCAPRYQIQSEDLRSKSGTIDVVFVSNVPESNFVTFAKGRPAGASKGMARGAPEGAGIAMYVGGPLARDSPGKGRQADFHLSIYITVDHEGPTNGGVS
jgi:hypothetical protein